MMRIDIHYGGELYSVGGRDLDDVQQEITRGLTAESGAWIEVNAGEGQRRPAHLLISRGTPIAVVAIPNGDEA